MILRAASTVTQQTDEREFGMLKFKTAALLAASMLVATPVFPAFAAEEPAAKAPSESQSFPAIRVVSTVERALTDRVIVTGTGVQTCALPI